MKFELKNEYVKKGSVTSSSTIVLPSGVSVGDGVLRVSIKYQELNTGASFSL